MNAADNLRNHIIDKLLTISNIDYLAALNQLIEKSSVGSEVVKLSEEQIIMLQMSDQDIANGNLMTQEHADKSDWEWLKGL